MMRRSARMAPWVIVGALAAALPASVLWSQADVDCTTLPLRPARFQGLITQDYRTSSSSPTPEPAAPASAPNVLFAILVDDAGYGQTGTFGGLIPTPTLDSLASGGLRFTRFHVTTLCSPTRGGAADRTQQPRRRDGRESRTGRMISPGYTASIPKSAALVSEILRRAGLRHGEHRQVAPDSGIRRRRSPDLSTSWPTRQGFDYFYGFLGGETDQWHPELVEGTAPTSMSAPAGREDDYTLTEDLANRARAWILRQKGSRAGPSGLHVLRAWRDPCTVAGAPEMDRAVQGRVRHGLGRVPPARVRAPEDDAGVIPADTVLTPRPAEQSPRGIRFSHDETEGGGAAHGGLRGLHRARRAGDSARVMGEAFRPDRPTRQHARRLTSRATNGAHLEGGLFRTGNIMAQVNGPPASPTADISAAAEHSIGGPLSNPHYPVGWAWAGNTPFQWGKRFGSHLGGRPGIPWSSPWPGHVQDRGGGAFRNTRT